MSDQEDRKTGRNREANTGAQVRIKVRVGEDAIGPGKIRLLELVESEGGISAAGRQMGLSYRCAWHLIDTLNNALGRPVVETTVGGEGGWWRATDRRWPCSCRPIPERLCRGRGRHEAVYRMVG